MTLIWHAAQPSGLLSDADINQYLRLHQIVPVHQPPAGTGAAAWNGFQANTVPGLQQWYPMTPGTWFDQRVTIASGVPSTISFARLAIAFPELSTGSAQFTTAGTSIYGASSLIVEDSSGIQQGMPVSGPGIVPGTTVTSGVYSGVTLLTISQAANYLAGSGEFTFGIIPGTDYATATDVTLSLYNDASGSLGSLIFTTTIPQELLTSIGSDLWPEPQDLIAGPSFTDPNATYPLSSFGSFPPFQSCTAGNVAAICLNSSSSVPSAVYTSVYDGNELGTWILGPNMPGSTKGYGTLVYSPTMQVLILVGGYTAGAGTGEVWTASIDQDGNVGAWQQQNSIGAPIYGPSVAIATIQGVDYIYVAGQSSSGSFNSGYVWYAVVGDSGSIRSWTQSNNGIPNFSNSVDYPSQQGGAAAGNTLAVVDNAWLLALGPNYGPTNMAIYACPLNPVVGTPGNWQQMTQSRVVTSSTLGSAQLLVLGNVVYWIQYEASSPIVYVTYAYTLAGGGGGSWITQGIVPMPNGTIYAAFDNADGSYTIFADQLSLPLTPGIRQLHLPALWVNVPLGWTGISPGGTYHVVVAVSGGNASAGVNVPLMSFQGGSGAAVRVSSNGGTTWTTLTGVMLPILLYSEDTNSFSYSQAVQLLGLIDDGAYGPAAGTAPRTSYLWIDPNTGELLDAAQWAGTARAVQLLAYNSDNSLGEIIEVA